MSRLARALPLLLVIAVLIGVVATGVSDRLSWAELRDHLVGWRALAARQPNAAIALYLAVYTVSVAISVPGSVWLTIAGGLLFGTVEGAALAVIAATCGAIPLFLATRHALAPVLERRARPLLARVGPILERDGFSGLLALRLLPVLPFWVLNLAPALVGMRLAPFAAATLIGIVPATLVFASIGAGLGDVLATGVPPDPSVIFSAQIFLPLLGLAMLSLLPVGWRRWKASHGRA